MNDLTTQRVTVSLGGREVLNAVDFGANRGEIVGLIGPNGAGKTTLLRVLSGLVSPDQGAVALEGIELSSIPRTALAKRIAYLPAEPTVHWPLRVDRLVALGRIPYDEFMRVENTIDASAINNAMTRTDILHLSNRTISSLSSGERTRVLIARALAVEPQVLIADEPVSSLDLYHQLQVMELLQNIAAVDRIVVVVLHDLTMAARFCDRIVVITKGHIVRDGKPSEVLKSDVIKEVYGVETIYTSTSVGEFILPWRRMDSTNPAS